MDVTVRTRLRVNLHTLVFAISGFAVFYPLKKAIDVWEATRYGAAYRRAEFVVERVVKEDAARWVEGHVEPGGVPLRFPAAPRLGGTFVIADDPNVAAQPGARMRIWWAGADMPALTVATIACVPDERMIAFWIAFAVALFFVAMKLTVRAGEYLQSR